VPLVQQHAASFIAPTEAGTGAEHLVMSSMEFMRGWRRWFGPDSEPRCGRAEDKAVDDRRT